MKRIISMLLLIAILVPLCACNQKDQAAAPAATLDPNSHRHCSVISTRVKKQTVCTRSGMRRVYRIF